MCDLSSVQRSRLGLEVHGYTEIQTVCALIRWITYVPFQDVHLTLWQCQHFGYIQILCIYKHLYIIYCAYVFEPKGHNTDQTNIWRALHLLPFIRVSHFTVIHWLSPLVNLTLYWHLVTLSDDYSWSINTYCDCGYGRLATIALDTNLSLSHAGYVCSRISTKQSKTMFCFPRPN